jgi:glycosyltransferase involved in cell wall biosynthesis
MAKFVEEQVFPSSKHLQNYSWKVIPGGESEDFFDSPNKIIWAHLPPSHLFDDYFDYFALPSFTKDVSAFVVQSEWHKKELLKMFDIPVDKVRVIPNAINASEFSFAKPKSHTIKMVYMSQLDRGLNVLLKALERISDQDIELLVYLPCDCKECEIEFSFLYTLKDPRVKVKEFVERTEFCQSLSEAHVFPYPCTWEETFCIALAEALAAGMNAVTSDIAALPGTSLGFAKTVRLNSVSLDKAASQYAKQLKKAIKQCRKGFDPTKQVEAITKAFSHERIKEEWLNLDAWLGTNR